MAHKCFFNTGFECTIQDIEELLKFGGTPTFVYEGDPEHKWTIVDRKLLPKKLQDLEKQYLFEPISFHMYENERSIKGTQQLYNDLQQKDTSSVYNLGYILYHQLLYTLTLTCIYQV